MEEEVEPKQKTSGTLVLILTGVAVTLVSIGAGWWLSNSVTAMNGDEAVSESVTGMKGKDDDKKSKDSAGEPKTASGGKIIDLDPIVVNLREPQGVWLRLELTAISSKEPDLGNEELKTRLSADIAHFLQTLKLKNISGPSGMIHLREDLIDWARISTSGQVEKILITSMVVE